MLPIYTRHMNPGVNQGSLLNVLHGLLTGSGTLIRHIDIKEPGDYRNVNVTAPIKEAIALAILKRRARPFRRSKRNKPFYDRLAEPIL